MRFNGSCPECGAKVSRFHKFDFGERFKGYRCENDHVITVMDDSEVISIKYPLQQLEAYPKCRRQLTFNIMPPPPGPVSIVPECMTLIFVAALLLIILYAYLKD